LKQEFVAPYSSEQHGKVERVIGPREDDCMCSHRFETLKFTTGVIDDRIRFATMEALTQPSA
jgi:hypothetical protein